MFKACAGILARARIVATLEEALEGYEYEWGVPAPDGVISMARYVPSMYHRDRAAIENYQVQNAGLLRSLLLKRFESSTAAFASTCRTMAGSHDALLEMIRVEGKIAKGRILADWINTEGDDEEVAVWLEANEEDLEDVNDYDVERLCDDLEKAHLEALAASPRPKPGIVVPFEPTKTKEPPAEQGVPLERTTRFEPATLTLAR